jgi:isopenicillin-N epimerase
LEFLLDPGVTFLNHGGYGACPAPVFARYQQLQRELERNPVEFLGRRFDELIAGARAALAAFVGARPDDLVFVPNATSGLNAVIRSLRLEPGDEVLTTRHEYGAVTRTWEFVGATLVHAEPEELVGAIGPRTKVVSISHITSPTALLLPVAEICAAAREAGALAIVDGAHAPGHVPLDLAALGADVYAGNCHNWRKVKGVNGKSRRSSTASVAASSHPCDAAQPMPPPTRQDWPIDSRDLVFSSCE